MHAKFKNVKHSRPVLVLDNQGILFGISILSYFTMNLFQSVEFDGFLVTNQFAG